MSGKAREHDGDDGEEQERPKKRIRNMFIEDAAEESGEEGDDVSHRRMLCRSVEHE
jgi:hypothetical protein